MAKPVDSEAGFKFKVDLPPKLFLVPMFRSRGVSGRPRGPPAGITAILRLPRSINLEYQGGPGLWSFRKLTR